jgi:hypothetical protein
MINPPPKRFQAYLLAFLQLGILERLPATRDGGRPLAPKYVGVDLENLPPELLNKVEPLAKELRRKYTREELYQMVNALQ